jgi:hypothetical protein
MSERSSVHNRRVTLPHFDLTHLPGEWCEVGSSEATQLEEQLRREVPEGHLLYKVAVRAVAVRRQLKDVVFWLPAVQQWAYVHLTGHTEQDPRWPSAVCTPEWDQVVAQFADD